MRRRDPENRPVRELPVFLEGLRVSYGRPAVWFTTWFMMGLLILMSSMPWFAWLENAISDYAPGSQLFSFTEVFRQDQRGDLSTLRNASETGGAVMQLVAMFFGVFAAGGWLQVVLERTHGQSLRRFFLGGARYFWRFWRLLLLTLLLLHLAGWIFYEWPWKQLVLNGLFSVPKHAYGSLETLASERTAFNLKLTQDALFALSFGAIMIWGVYTRTRIALNDTSSAFLAGLASIGLMLRHPIRTLRPMLLLFVIETGILLGAGFLARNFQAGLETDATLWRVVALFGVGQFALLMREALRGAGYCAAVRVSQDLVEPVQADPYSSAIGGPGGPRYPIDDGDEYGVSM